MGAFDFLNNIVGGLGNLLGDHKNTTTNTNAASSGTQAATGFSQSNLWPQLSGLFGNFSSAFTPQGPNAYQTGAATTLAGLPGSLGNATGVANYGAAGGLYNAGSYQPFMSPYTTEVVNKTLALQDQQNKSAANAIRGNMAAQHSLGNNVGTLPAYFKDVVPGQQAQIAALEQAGFNQANQNAQTAAGLQYQGAGLAGNLANTQGNLASQAFSAGQQLWQNPFLQFGQVSSAISPWAAASGQNTSNQGTYSGNQNTVGNTNTQQYNGGNILGGLGQLAGGLFGLFSDERVKENIAPIGKSFDGQPIYRFNYKGSPATQIGLIAQDVEKRNPDAVGSLGGIKTVDYDRATAKAAHKGHFALGGGVGLGHGGSFADKVEHAFHSFHRMRKHAQDGGKVRHFDIGGDVGGWAPTITGSLGDTSNDYWDTIQNQAIGNDPRLNGDATGFGGFAQGLGKTFKDMGATGGKSNSAAGAEPQMKAPDLMGQGFQRLSTLMRPPALGIGYAGGGDVERRGFADGDAVLPEGYDPSGMDVAPLSEPAAPAVPSYLGARERAAPAVPYSGYHRDVPQSAIAPISKWDQAMGVLSNMGGPAGSVAGYNLKLNQTRLDELAAQRAADVQAAELTGRLVNGEMAFPAAMKIATMTGRMPNGEQTPAGLLTAAQTRLANVQAAAHDPRLTAAKVALMEASDRGEAITPELADRIFKQFGIALPEGTAASTAQALVTGATPTTAAPTGTPSPQRSAGFAPEVETAIQGAAQRTGIPAPLLRTFAAIESGGNPAASNGRYQGLFQMSPELFQKYGVQDGDILNPEHNANAAAAKFKDDIAGFVAKYNREPSLGELYLMHQQGTGGAEALWNNPNSLAWKSLMVTQEGRARGPDWAKAAIWNNIPDAAKRQYGSVDNVTSKAFTDMWNQRTAQIAQAVQSATPAPPGGAPGVPVAGGQSNMPQGGDLTARALRPNASAPSTVERSLQTPEDIRLRNQHILFPELKGYLENTPGHKGRVKEEELRAAKRVETEEKQTTGREIERQIDELRDRMVAAGPDVVNLATGPWLGDPAWQKRLALVTPGSETFKTAQEVNTKIQHTINAIATQMAMNSGGQKSTDQARGELKSAVGEAFQSRGAAGVFEVLRDAKANLQGLYHLPIDPVQKDYYPDEWRKKGFGPPAAANAAAPAAPARTAEPGAVRVKNGQRYQKGRDGLWYPINPNAADEPGTWTGTP